MKTMVIPIELTIDTNVINARGKLSAMNKLEEWHDQYKVELMVSDVMENELIHGSPQYHKQVKYIFHFLRPGQDYPILFKKFRTILFSTAAKLTKQQIADINHIIAHQKYRHDIFVTNDNNFIRHRSELKGEGIRVMTPKECVEFLKKIYGWR